MRRFLSSLAVLVALASPVVITSCAPLTSGLSFVTTAKVDQNSVYIARNAFLVVEAAADNYNRQRRCVGSQVIGCRLPAVTARINPAVRSGIIARNKLVQFTADHPDQIGMRGAYNALVGATDVLKAIYIQYNIR
jgi:hypothetical protein